MAIDDEFFLDDDDLDADFAITPVEREKIVVIDGVKDILDKISTNIKLKEKSEESKNLQILSNYVSALIELEGMEKSNVSDSELLERIKEIDDAVRELSFVDVCLDVPVDEENVSGIDLIDGDDFEF